MPKIRTRVVSPGMSGVLTTEGLATGTAVGSAVGMTTAGTTQQRAISLHFETVM